MIRWVAVSVGVVLIGLIGLLAVAGGDGSDDSSSAWLGRRVPAIAGETIDGTAFDIDSLRGEWVVLNLFGSWCPPCVEEHPELVELDRWGRETGQAAVVSIAFQDTTEGAADFFERYGGDWPVLVDSQLALELGVAQVPETFLISPTGIVAAHWSGTITADGVQATIDELESGQ